MLGRASADAVDEAFIVLPAGVIVEKTSGAARNARVAGFVRLAAVVAGLAPASNRGRGNISQERTPPESHAHRESRQNHTLIKDIKQSSL